MYPDGDCPYEWSILPIEILGNIYEKFLGSEIILKNVSGGKATAIIEEKPEVKKADKLKILDSKTTSLIQSSIGQKLKNVA